MKTVQIFLSQLYSKEWKIRETLCDINENRLSFETGNPIEVVCVGRGKFVVVDGHHRALEAILAGASKISAFKSENVHKFDRMVQAIAAEDNKLIDFVP